MQKKTIVQIAAFGFACGWIGGCIGSAADSTPQEYIPCPDPVITEDDACVLVPLWAVDGSITP